MIEILPLQNNYIAVIDTMNYLELSQYKWYFQNNMVVRNAYNMYEINKWGNFIRLDHFLMNYQENDNTKLIHLNGIELDFRMRNLRIINKNEHVLYIRGNKDKRIYNLLKRNNANSCLNSTNSAGSISSNCFNSSNNSAGATVTTTITTTTAPTATIITPIKTTTDKKVNIGMSKYKYVNVGTKYIFTNKDKSIVRIWKPCIRYKGKVRIKNFEFSPRNEIYAAIWVNKELEKMGRQPVNFFTEQELIDRGILSCDIPSRYLI